MADDLANMTLFLLQPSSELLSLGEGLFQKYFPSDMMLHVITSCNHRIWLLFFLLVAVTSLAYLADMKQTRFGCYLEMTATLESSVIHSLKTALTRSSLTLTLTVFFGEYIYMYFINDVRYSDSYCCIYQ